MNLDRAWLLANGIDRATLDAAIAAAPRVAVSAPRGPREPRAKLELPSGMPGRWEVVIEGWRPTFASELKCHPLIAAGKKRRDAETIHEACLEVGVAAPIGRRRVAIRIENRYGRLPDPDAPLKSTLDALKTAGAIVDDSERWLTWDIPKFGRGPKRTMLTIEDIG